MGGLLGLEKWMNLFVCSSQSFVVSSKTWCKNFEVYRGALRMWGAEPGVTLRTRHEHIHVGSVATSLSLTVLRAIPRPITEYPRAKANK